MLMWIRQRILTDLVVDGHQLFLVRPRRFGKSLLLDTIRCIFMDNGERKDRASQSSETHTSAAKIITNNPTEIFLRQFMLQLLQNPPHLVREKDYKMIAKIIVSGNYFLIMSARMVLYRCNQHLAHRSIPRSTITPDHKTLPTAKNSQSLLANFIIVTNPRRSFAVRGLRRCQTFENGDESQRPKRTHKTPKIGPKSTEVFLNNSRGLRVISQ